jgi:hypothetical protein
MNHSIFTHCLLTASLVVGSVVAAQAQVVTTSQLLHPGSRCDHVIGLMHRHGVNNSVDRTATHSMLHHSRFGPMVIPDTELGDLEVVQVNQIAHEDPACGPKLAVIVRNQSCRAICNFHVSAVAVFGRICPTSPNATVAVEQIAPGETLEVLLPLPIEALAMGNRNGQVIGFQTLVVAIDSLDQLVETNEANNLKAFDIAEVPFVTIGVEETVETVETVATETAVQQSPVTAEAAPFFTGEVDQPTSDPLRSAIQKLVPNQADEARVPAAP